MSGFLIKRHRDHRVNLLASVLAVRAHAIAAGAVGFVAGLTIAALLMGESLTALILFVALFPLALLSNRLSTAVVALTLEESPNDDAR